MTNLKGIKYYASFARNNKTNMKKINIYIRAMKYIVKKRIYFDSLKISHIYNNCKMRKSIAQMIF